MVRVRVDPATIKTLLALCSPTSSLYLYDDLRHPMAPIAVKIKHAGKVHDVQLDPDQPATLFKDAVYQVTGVPPDRMKVMIKGGILKVRFFPL